MTDSKPPLTPLGEFTLAHIPASYVNVRATPSTDGKSLGVLHLRDAATLYAPDENGFVYLTAPTVEGWVSRQNGKVVFTPFGNPWSAKLSVPYVAQQGTTANARREDCGAACAVMLARYAYEFGGYLDPVNFTVDDFAAKTRLATADVGLTCPQVAALLQGYGLKAEARTGLTLDNLRTLIHDENPPIVLVNYAHINPAHPATLGHFVPLIGYNATAFLCHDPYLLGANVTITNEALTAAMREVSSFTNAPFQAVALV